MPKKRDDTKKVQQSVGLPPEWWELIDELVQSKDRLYGDSRGEVARNLIRDQLTVIAKHRLLTRKK